MSDSQNRGCPTSRYSHTDTGVDQEYTQCNRWCLVCGVQVFGVQVFGMQACGVRCLELQRYIDIAIYHDIRSRDTIIVS